MNKHKIIWAVLIVTVAVVALLTPRAGRRPQYVPSGGADSDLQQVVGLIAERYHRPLSEEQLVQAAIRGMIDSLDPHCAYLPPDLAQAIERRFNQALVVGVGLTVESEAGRLIVAAVDPGSPACHAALRPRQVILALAGTPAGELTPATARELLDVPAGTTVNILLDQPGGAVEIPLLAGEYPIDIVQGLWRDLRGRWQYVLGGPTPVGYIRLSEFLQPTHEQLQLAFRQMHGAAGLILDLRDNPGGKLEAAAAVADLFLKDGLLAITVARDGPAVRHRAHRDGTLPEVPLVVLVNECSASGAELVAGAIRMNGRGVLVGQRTHGKGAVQSVINLGEHGRIVLTTADLMLAENWPVGRWADGHRWGVEPHVHVPLPADNRQPLAALRTQLAAYSRGESTVNSADDTPTARQRMLLALDSQLAEAVALLGEPARMEELIETGRAEDAATVERLKEQACDE